MEGRREGKSESQKVLEVCQHQETPNQMKYLQKLKQ